MALNLQWDKRLFKGPWSSLLKPAPPKQNRSHSSWVLQSMLHFLRHPRAAKSQQGGPAKPKYEMVCSEVLSVGTWCSWTPTRERDKGPSLFPLWQPRSWEVLPLVLMGGCKMLRWHEAASWLAEGMFILSRLAWLRAARRGTAFPRSLAGISSDGKCLAKCLLSHFANKAGVRPLLLVGI